MNCIFLKLRPFLLIAFFAFSSPASAKSSLLVKKIKFSNGAVLSVEVADTPLARQKGLMHREKLAENTGMLFVFQKEDILSFWMKETYIPLTIGYFSKEKKLIDVLNMEPQGLGPTKFQDLPSYRSSEPCLYAIEVNFDKKTKKSWFAKNGVRRGDSFTIPGL